MRAAKGPRLDVTTASQSWIEPAGRLSISKSSVHSLSDELHHLFGTGARRGRADLLPGQWLQIEDEGSQEDLGLCQDFGLGLWVMDRGYLENSVLRTTPVVVA